MSHIMSHCPQSINMLRGSICAMFINCNSSFLFCYELSEYDPVYQTLHFSNASLMHCISDSTCYATPHMAPLLVCLFVYLCHWCTCCLFCLFVSPSGLVLLIDVQWTSAKSDCTCSIRRGLGRRLRSSLLLNSSPSTSRDHPLVA